ncbi:MAG: hypothetical protein Q7S92_00390 [Candidatus Diapherotrites archaeon]|nr:hypothetical protein [Candidatus Diapherotrites archaeon]
MDFKLAQGPWKNIFSGQLEGHFSELLSSNEEFILSLVNDEEKGKKLGVLMECFLVYSVQGDLERLLEGQKGKALGLIVKGEKVEKYLMFSTTASYVSYNESAINQEVQEMIQRLEERGKAIQESSIAFEVELKKLKECSSEEKELFYSTPLIHLIFTAKQTIHVEKSIVEKTISIGETIIGITKEGTGIKEPFAYFKSALVVGGERKNRIHALRVLTESALLSRIPVIAFEFESEFSGLGNPSKDRKKLEKYKVDLEPLGFPTKTFEIIKDIRINLGKIDGLGFAELFGIENEKIKKEIVNLLNQKKFTSMTELISNAEKMPTTETFSDFNKQRMVRMLRVIDQVYPEILGDGNNVSEILKAAHKTLGRANIISLRSKDYRKNSLIIESILKELLELYESGKETSDLVIVLPKAEHILSSEQFSTTLQAIQDSLGKLQSKNKGVILEAENENEISEQAKTKTSAIVSLVKENDAAIQIQGQKSYRCFIRPSLSSETENLVEIIDI